MSEEKSEEEMPKGISNTAMIAGAAIGSAAIAAALLYASRRKAKAKPAEPPKTPTGEPPETD